MNISGCRSPRHLSLVLGLLLGLIAASGQTAPSESDPKQYAVQVSATVQESPAQITLNWPARGTASTNDADGFIISRKLKSETRWTEIGTRAGSTGTAANSFTDTNVKVGDAYEYKVAMAGAVGANSDQITFNAYGYVMAGIRAPMIEQRGKVILLVDNRFTTPLATELARLEQDLVGDGWTVLRHDLSASLTAPQVKAVITADYQADPANVRALLILGHLAVPRSGLQNPDGHEDHYGAWSADTYYADVDGAWTDTTVDNTALAATYNITNPKVLNVPGDGKFDQRQLPSNAELEVGRVDFYGMPSFALSEQQLLKQYLDKNHNYRHRLISIPQNKGLIRDGFGLLGVQGRTNEMAANGWWNFSSLFGSANVNTVAEGQFFSTLKTTGYYWAYGCGPGSNTSAYTVGGTGDFATVSNDPRAIFMMLAGSYFGDFDADDNLLRAALGTSTYTLGACWALAPNYFFHHAGLGETVGYGVRLSMNNETYLPFGPSHRAVSMAWMGDPTLRMYPVQPVAALSATASATGVTLGWTASPAAGLQGYAIYRAPSAAGPFTRLNATLVTGTSYLDQNAPAGSPVYMVRAVRLEQAYTNASTFLNPSQGVFATATVGTAAERLALTGGNRAISSGSTATSATDGTHFGAIRSGGTSTRTFTLTNRGTGTLNVGAITFSGANASEFTVTQAPAATLAAGASTTFTLQAAPTATGTRTATVSIASNDPNYPATTFAVAVTAGASTTPTAPTRSVVALKNTPIDIVLTGTVANADDAAAYAIVTAPAHGSLTGTGSQRTYTPAAGYVGADTFTYTVSDGASTSAPATVTIDVRDLAGGLRLHLKLDETSGTAASDSSGNGNHGTFTGTPSWQAGKVDNAAVLNQATNTYITVLNSPTLDIAGNAVTVACWTWSDGDATVAPSFLSKEAWRSQFLLGPTYAGMAWQLKTGSTIGTLYTRESLSNGYDGIEPYRDNTTTDRWVHWTGTYDGATMRLYRDGVEVASKAQTGAIPSDSATFLVGFQLYSGNYLKGKIDDVRIYNRALSPLEVTALVASTTTPPASAAAPTFSPAAGTYTSAQNVTITTATSGATIRYTTNGTAPTATTGTVYTGPVSIASTTTLRAIATKAGLTDSAVVDAVYTIESGGQTPALLTGSYLGTSGSYGNDPSVIGAKAFDGNTATFFDGPTGDGNWVGLDLGVPHQLTSVRYYPRSTFAYRMNGGIFQGSNTADFSSGVVNLFTITSDPAYAWNAATITSTATFRYVRYLAPAGSYGNVAELEFIGFVPSSGGTVANPVFNPPAGTYTGAQSVTLSTSTSGATIRYTTDGSTPTSTTGTVYTGAINVAATATLRAIAYKSGSGDSSVVTAAYTVTSGPSIYYVDASTGDDFANGTSPGTAWRSLAKVAARAAWPGFVAGDEIRFQGGQTFTFAPGESLYFPPGKGGTTANPVTITSYGTGKAVLVAADNKEFAYVYNTAGIRFKTLTIKGNGSTTHTKDGISFYCDVPNTRFEGIYFDDLDVHGFGKAGAVVGGWGTMAGFGQVLVTNSSFHDNGTAGFGTYGQSPYANVGVTVRNSHFYNNKGFSGQTTPTGSGLVLGSVDTGLVEYCTAYNNGENNTHSAGPVGIWTYLSRKVLIQYNESYGNRSQDADGGGFDIDGGCEDCVMQYNYSHDNDGAGFLLAQYTPAGVVYRNNVVRYNISQNDGRSAKGYGGITIWGGDGTDQLSNAQIYNNVVYVGATSHATASGFYAFGAGGYQGVVARNNIFVSTGGRALVKFVNHAGTASLKLEGNNYHASGGAWLASINGTGYSSLALFRGTGQEKAGATDLGTDIDPLLVSAGAAGTVANPYNLAASLGAYRLQSGSALINAGLVPPTLTGTAGSPAGTAATVDFYGNATPLNAYDVGVHENLSASTADVTSGLSARLAFDESSGTSAADSSGNGKTGTLQNGAGFAAGKINNGISLDGATAYVGMPVVFNPSTQADFTVSAWVRLSAVNGGSQMIVQQEDGSGTGRTWLYRNAAGQLASFLGNAETTSSATLSTNTWYHVALVKTGSSLQLYVNGSASGSPATRSVESTVGAMRIGAHKVSTTQSWNGLIDEVRFYNRALSGAELSTVYAWSGPALQSQTITFGALAAKTYGDAAFALGATASSGLAVTYTSSNPAVATISGSTVTLQGAGTSTITAMQAGNGTYAAATSVPQTLTVNAAPSLATTSAALSGAAIGTATGNSSVLPGGVWEVTGTGAGMSGTADNLWFESKAVSGDFQVLVRVLSVSGGSSPRAGVMVRGTTAAGSIGAFSTVGTDARFHSGVRAATNGSLTNFDPVSPAATLPATWVMVERVGNILRTAVSTNDVTWTQLSETTVSSLPTSVQVGLFVGSGSAGVPAKATFEAGSFEIVPLSAVPSGRVGAWDFNENSGTTTADVNGGGLTASAAQDSAFPSWVASGQTGAALGFNGTTQGLGVPNNAALNVSSGMTLTLWVKPTTWDAGSWVNRTVAQRGRWGWNRVWALEKKNANDFSFWIRALNGGAGGEVLTTSLPPLNQWTHVAATYSSATGVLALYYNGVLQNSATFPTGTSIGSSFDEMRLGTNDNSGSYNGQLDGVRLFNRALSASELLSLP